MTDACKTCGHSLRKYHDAGWCYYPECKRGSQCPNKAEDVKGLHISWLGGNCPVQAEGSFDGVFFYFRARGSSVFVEVGDADDLWTWRGPSFEWPHAGWISEEEARGFILEAYEEWKKEPPKA